MKHHATPAAPRQAAHDVSGAIDPGVRDAEQTQFTSNERRNLLFVPGAAGDLYQALQKTDDALA